MQGTSTSPGQKGWDPYDPFGLGAGLKTEHGCACSLVSSAVLGSSNPGQRSARCCLLGCAAAAAETAAPEHLGGE